MSTTRLEAIIARIAQGHADPTTVTFQEQLEMHDELAEHLLDALRRIEALEARA